MAKPLFLASAVLAGASAYQLGAPLGVHVRAAASPRMEVATDFGLAAGQKYGPTAPAHPAPGLPWTNLEKQEEVQLIKAKSHDLRQPLLNDMGAPGARTRALCNAGIGALQGVSEMARRVARAGGRRTGRCVGSW